MLSGAAFLTPQTTQAASAGIFASGGRTITVGQSFTVSVVASGATFDSLQGQINVSGPVSILSFSSGSGTWLPGKTPGNGNTFVGITSATSSLTVATLTLKGTSVGSGSVSVSGAELAHNGTIVATGSGNTSFTVLRAPDPPGTVSVTSSSHPNQSQAYTATTINLTWTKTSGMSGFSFGLDQSANTTPTAALSQVTSVTYANKAVGTYYFHIRAQNGDGWGPTTNFKITIKEPDPTIDSTLTKPTITSFVKDSDFATDLDNGTLQNFTIKGMVPVGYTANLSFNPNITVPSGKSLSVAADADGTFADIVDYPVKSGFYTLTVQGQQNKTLTPMSDTYKIELSVANGGTIRFITDNDQKAQKITINNHDYIGPAQRSLVWWTVGSTVIVLLGLGAIASYFWIWKPAHQSNDWKKKK